MTATLLRKPVSVALPAGCGALAALLAADGLGRPGRGLLAAAGVIVVVAVWPWLALPTVVIGGTVISHAVGFDGAGSIVGVHVALAALAILGIALRRALSVGEPSRPRTPADVPMLALAATVVLGAAYGLAAGNAPHEVIVATYHFGVVPVYFFLATATLSTPGRLRAACVVFAFGAAVVAVAGLVRPGDAGLFATLALPPALAGAATVRSLAFKRLLLAAGSLFAIAVILGGYRTLWVAAGVPLALLLARGGALRRSIAAVLAVVLVMGLTVAFARPEVAAEQLGAVRTTLTDPGGYRLAEARIGWEVFEQSPLVGEGLGQVEPDVYIPDFRVTDVGPEYHLFYVMLLANLGLVGLAVFLWPLVVALRRGGDGEFSVAFRMLLVGWLVAAFLAGPSDGHWELGLLAALVLLTARFEPRRAQA